MRYTYFHGELLLATTKFLERPSRVKVRYDASNKVYFPSPHSRTQSKKDGVFTPSFLLMGYEI